MTSQLSRPAPSRQLQAIRAALESGDLPKGSTPGFRRALDKARSIRDTVVPVSLDGLKLIKCRRCGGTGEYRMQHGWGACSGHGRLGVCVNGKSLGPTDRLEYQRRCAQRILGIHRATWKALATLQPITKTDHHELARALDNVELHGWYARRDADSINA